MRTPTSLAPAGLEELTDFASFPNLEQIGVLLLVLALIGLIVLIAMLSGVKALGSALRELAAQLSQAQPAPAMVGAAPPAGGQSYGPPPEVAQPRPVTPEPSEPFAAIVAEPPPAETGLAFAGPAAPVEPAVAAEPVPAEPPPAAPEVAIPTAAPPQAMPPVGGEALPKALNTAARREISLVGRALKILDELEQSETDPDKLFSLFALDNLMARMRRGSETQMILAGRDPERSVREALSVSDVVRTASSQIEHYERIRISLDWDPMIRSYAVVPVAHLIAELLENATTFSPEGTAVEVGSSNHSGDVVVTVSDTGVGMNPQELAAANKMMQAGGNPDDLTHGRLGVAVVARLAARLGAAVSFAPGQGESGTGTTAIVRIPSHLVDERPQAAPAEETPAAEPALPPQPKLEPSAVTESPTPEESFQPVRLEAPEGGGLPRRSARGQSAQAPKGAQTPPGTQTGQRPQTAPGAQSAPPASPPPAAPPLPTRTPTSARGAEAGPSPDGAPAVTRRPAPPARGAGAGAGASASRTDAIVPLGARFSPLGSGASPAGSSLPRHSAQPPATATPAGQTASSVAGPPGPAEPAAPFPFGGAPAGAAQPAGREPKSATPAPPGASATPPVLRRAAATRAPAADRFPPVPATPGVSAPHTTAPPGVIQPAAAPGLPRRAAPPLAAPAMPTVPRPTGATSFQPSGTMTPGPAMGIPDLSSPIAGSALALKASIQEEALAELAGINAYKPERTESRPASSLARRQTGQSVLPAPATAPAGPPKARDADKVRNALSSFQLGTRRGRSDARAPAGKG
ncbi:MAG: hypothetical protein LBD77_11610 [Bifidobacteriaceae bacterium]|jgi:anti-sigma regulatory factor (Ser/Thr protein kinase)|nr:hypothetical protein [Bifidobacteriaceae bacterium]